MRPLREGEIVPGSSVPIPKGARCPRCQRPCRDPDVMPYCCADCGVNARQEAELSQDALRRLVFARDQGVCALCGEDCLKVRDTADAFRELGGDAWQTHLRLLAKSGFDRDAVVKGHALWECDHINPQVKGGPSTPENARTLCRPCHVKVTGELASSRAQSRRPLRDRTPRGRRR